MRSTSQGKAVRGSRILVLGVAYKKDIDDMRESPALDIIRLLEQQGAKVSYHDPYVPASRKKATRFDVGAARPETVAGGGLRDDRDRPQRRSTTS